MNTVVKESGRGSIQGLIGKEKRARIRFSVGFRKCTAKVFAYESSVRNELLEDDDEGDGDFDRNNTKNGDTIVSTTVKLKNERPKQDSFILEQEQRQVIDTSKNFMEIEDERNRFDMFLEVSFPEERLTSELGTSIVRFMGARGILRP